MVLVYSMDVLLMTSTVIHSLQEVLHATTNLIVNEYIDRSTIRRKNEGMNELVRGIRERVNLICKT